MNTPRNLVVAAIAVLGLAVGNAYALPAASTALVPGGNQLSDDSAEILVNNDANPSISPGDYLVGMFGITSFPTSGVDASSVNEVTAIFALEIATVTPVPAALIPSVCGSALIASCSGFTFIAPGAGFNVATASAGVGLPAYTDIGGGALPASTVAVVLEDAANDFDRDGLPIPGAFASASGGTERLIIGLVGSDSWTGTGPTSLAEFFLVPSGTGIGGYSIIATITGQDVPGFVFAPQITGNGTIKPTSLSSFTITDDTTLEVNVALVPEPATLGLLGIAVLALGGAVSRRRRS